MNLCLWNKLNVKRWKPKIRTSITLKTRVWEEILEHKFRYKLNRHMVKMDRSNIRELPFLTGSEELILSPESKDRVQETVNTGSENDFVDQHFGQSARKTKRSFLLAQVS